MARRIIFGLWCWYVIARWPSVKRYGEGDFEHGRAYLEPTRLGYRIRNWRDGHGFVYGGQERAADG